MGSGGSKIAKQDVNMKHGSLIINIASKQLDLQALASMRSGSEGGWVDYPAFLQFSEKLCCLGLLKQETLFELPYSSMLHLRLSLVTHQEGNQRKKRKQTGEREWRTRE